jgi:hypothetical protein
MARLGWFAFDRFGDSDIYRELKETAIGKMRRICINTTFAIPYAFLFFLFAISLNLSPNKMSVLIRKTHGRNWQPFLPHF